MPTAGEGFRVDIRNSSGTVIQFQTCFPTLYAWKTLSPAVPLDPGAFPDTNSVRFTKPGPNNSLGSIIAAVSFLVGFTAGTLTDTPLGRRRGEDLCPGVLVLTMDDGPQPIRWVGSRTVTGQEMRDDPQLRPVLIAAGALGPAQPSRDLMMQRQHRILRSGWTCELHFAEPKVLVPAHWLVNGPTVQIALPERGVSYAKFPLRPPSDRLGRGADHGKLLPRRPVDGRGCF